MKKFSAKETKQEMPILQDSRSIELADRSNPASIRNKKTEDRMFNIFIMHLIFQYLRPQDMVGILSLFNLPFIFQSLMIFYAIYRGLPLIQKNKTVYWVLTLCIFSLITLAYVVNHNAWYNNTMALFSYLFSLIIPALLLINSTARLISLVKIWIIIHCLLAFWVITHGGRGPGAFVSDENDVAMVLAMAVPYPLLLLREKLLTGLWRWIARAAIPIMIIGVVATNSRGSFLGLAAVVIGYLYFYRASIRAILSIMLVCLIGFLLAPQEFKNEIISINDTEDSTRNDRIDSWKAGIFMFSKNSILGVGTGNYPWRIADYELLMNNNDVTGRLHGGRVAHSLYVTLLAELGGVGVLIFIILVSISISDNLTASKANIRAQVEKHNRAEKRDRDIIQTIAKANIISLGSFLVSAVFISVFYYPCLWFLLAFSATLRQILLNSCKD